MRTRTQVTTQPSRAVSRRSSPRRPSSLSRWLSLILFIVFMPGGLILLPVLIGAMRVRG